MQKRLNITPSKSSAVNSPVISLHAFCARRRCSASSSSWWLPQRAALSSSRWAVSSAWMWRLRARNKPSLSPCQPTASSKACLSKSKPAPVLADSLMSVAGVSVLIFRLPIWLSIRLGVSLRKSALLWITMRVRLLGSLFNIACVAALMPSAGSIKIRATSAFCTAFSLRSMPIFSTKSSVSRSPAVSVM